MRLFIIVLICFPCLVSAQDVLTARKTRQKPENNLLLSGTYLRHLNKMDIETHGSHNFLSVPNTNGYQLNLDYERITRYNLVYSVGIGYGQQVQDTRWDFDLNGILPVQAGNKYKIVLSYHDIANYYTYNIAVGYQYQPFKNKKIKLLTKIGLVAQKYLNGDGRYLLNYTLYKYGPEPNNIGIALVASTYSAYGHANEGVGHPIQWYILSFQAGTRYPIDLLFINEIRFNLRFTYALNTDETSSGIYFNTSGDKIGYELYSDRFRTIGIGTSLVF